MSVRLLPVLLVTLAAATLPVDAMPPPETVAPMPPWLRLLRGEDAARAAALTGRILQHEAADRYPEALDDARELLALRVRVQGVDHPESVRLRWVVQRLQTLAALSSERRQQWRQSVSRNAEGNRLANQGRPGEALPLFQNAAAVQSALLGERHPDAVANLNGMAHCLFSLGRPGDALLLFGKARDINRALLGERHPDTVIATNNLAYCLNDLGRSDEALPLYRKAVDTCRSVHGERHVLTASLLGTLSECLNDLGRPADALPLLRRALQIHMALLGERHRETATTYNALGMCVNALGRSADALPLFRKAVAIRRAVLGERHPDTVTATSNLAVCLQDQGQTAAALPLLRQCLEIGRAVQGEGHPDTAAGYTNLAYCLQAGGNLAAAASLYRKALELTRAVRGENRANTAAACNNLAACLREQGQPEAALPLYREALAIRRAVLGEDHPLTAQSYSNLAACLQECGRTGEALPLLEKALAIRHVRPGEQHPDTANSHNNLAACLRALGRPEESLPHYQHALRIRRAVQGESHPETAVGYLNLAACLHELDRPEEAARHWEKALLGFEYGRLSASRSGFERTLFQAESLSPRAALAATLAHLGRPVEAWQHAESDLGRGLLDDLAGKSETSPDEEERRARLKEVQDHLLALLTTAAPDDTGQRRELTMRRDRLQLELAEAAVRRTRDRVLPLDEIQAQIPGDGALIFWIDIAGLKQHRGCVLRSTGRPVWIDLPGSGAAGAWTRDDDTPIARALAALADPTVKTARVQSLLQAVHRQRLAPLEPHLGGVRQLVVVPSGRMAALPVEALTDRFTVSYTPSASVFARLRGQHRPTAPGPALVLADPVFTRPEVVGKDTSDEVVASAMRSGDWKPLPGTRVEALTLQTLIPETTLLLGSDACESELAEFAASGKLKRFRILHLATHGEANPQRPELTALVLAQDRLPSPQEQERRVLAGQQPTEGRLTVETILRDWDLDADLVVLSACESGLGKATGGEGMLGFTQALLQKHARSVVLSRWKIDDTATALLMRRFYQNLLGKRDGLKAPMDKAAALQEARDWLRDLNDDEVKSAEKTLRGGVRPRSPAAAPSVKPYAHPHYWAAFILVGDPD